MIVKLKSGTASLHDDGSATIVHLGETIEGHWIWSKDEDTLWLNSDDFEHGWMLPGSVYDKLVRFIAES